MARAVAKGPGRLEVRTLRTTSIRTGHAKWRGLARGFEITRERTIRGTKTVEIGYGVPSLSADRATAADLLAHRRDHCRIETELHYVRAMTLKEDACRVRPGAVPQGPAALRNAVVHRLSRVETASCPEALERLRLHPEKARRLIGIPQGGKGMALARASPMGRAVLVQIQSWRAEPRKGSEAATDSLGPLTGFRSPG